MIISHKGKLFSDCEKNLKPSLQDFTAWIQTLRTP